MGRPERGRIPEVRPDCGRLLVVAHQYRPALGEPAQGAFHHPPSGGVGFLAPLVQLLLCAGYVHSIGRRQLSRGLWDCHTLCPSTGFERLAGAPLLCSPRSVSRVSYHGRWLQPPLRSGVRLLRRPGCSSCSRLCPGRWGCVQWRAPKTRFAYRAIRRLPFPVHAAQLLAFSIRTAQMASSAPHPTQRWSDGWCCRPPTPWAGGSTGNRFASER